MDTKIFVINLISFGLLLFSFKTYIGIFYEKRDRSRKFEIGFVCVYFIVASYTPYIGLVGNLLMTTIRECAYGFCFYRGNDYKFVLAVFLYELLGCACEFMIAPLILRNNSDGIMSEQQLYLGMILAASISLFVVLFLKKALKPQKNKELNKQQWGILTLLALATFLVDVCVYVIYIHSTRSSDGYYAIFAAVLMNVITIILFKVYEQLTDKAELEMRTMIYQQQAEIYKRQIWEREHTVQEFRRLRHDMKNHLLLAQEFLDECKYKEVSQYIKKLISNEGISPQFISKSGNAIVDGLINYKASYIDNMNIDFRVEIEMPRDISIPDVNLCIILGNLLDNAIEGVERVETGTRNIHLAIKYKKKSLFMSITNSYNKDIVNEKNSIFTSSKPTANHGLGLPSVERAVEECGGSMVITQEGNLFKVTVVLPDGI